MIPDEPTIRGYSLTLIPRSWAVGRWIKLHKVIYSLGPLRFTIHEQLGQWKPNKRD